MKHTKHALLVVGLLMAAGGCRMPAAPGFSDGGGPAYLEQATVRGQGPAELATDVTCSDCAGDGCRQCRGRHSGNGGLFGMRGRRNAQQLNGYDGGPPTAAVSYPYYTTRGPRDFLAPSPRGIGP